MNTRISRSFSTAPIQARPAVHGSRTHRPTAQQFDQVQLSKRPQGMEGQARELADRISRQVRLRHTTGELDAIHTQIQNGTYQPDASEIAARMLLIREDD